MAEKIAGKAYSSDTILSTFELDAALTRVADLTIEKKIRPNATEFKQKELRGELLPEPLLVEDKTRFVLFPIKHNDVSPFTASSALK
jgi:hypothetical protein